MKNSKFEIRNSKELARGDARINLIQNISTLTRSTNRYPNSNF
jgi:hypothetical protein